MSNPMGNEFKLSSEAFSFRRRSWLFGVSIILFLCSLQCTANVAELQKMWDIQDPDAKICRAEGELDSTIPSKVCDNSSSVIQMEYAIHKNAKFPKYKIFQKDCQETFEAGTQPIKGSVSPDEDNRFELTKAAGTGGGNSVSASLEILLGEDSLKSSWWERLIHSESKQQTIEFCIRMGLWLPPQAGKTEINFRETNVAVTFDKDDSISEGHGYVVTNVALDHLELKKVKINLGGSAPIKPEAAGADDKDEL